MANTTKIVYVTKEQYNSLITTGSVTVGGVTYTYNANNTYLVREDGVEGVDIKSTNATNGKVLTANGSGGASWQTAGGGGGSGDVTASGTLTNNSIILGNGTKSVKAIPAGTSGQFLKQGQNGPEWNGLYLHSLHLYYAGDEFTGETSLYFSVICTNEYEYSDLNSIPNGRYIASGDYNDTFNGNGHCRVLFFDTNFNEVGHWETVNESVNVVALAEAALAEITDSVTQIL